MISQPNSTQLASYIKSILEWVHIYIYIYIYSRAPHTGRHIDSVPRNVLTKLNRKNASYVQSILKWVHIHIYTQELHTQLDILNQCREVYLQS